MFFSLSKLGGKKVRKLAKIEKKNEKNKAKQEQKQENITVWKIRYVPNQNIGPKEWK